MHLYQIKPRRFFYLIDTIIKNMLEIKNVFYACRIVITGKLKGGTARTGKYKAGFGDIPRQTLAFEIRTVFKQVESKYGSYGIKLTT